MWTRLRQLFRVPRTPRPYVLAITSCYMDQMALRIAASCNRWDLVICPTVEGALLLLENFCVSVIVYDLDTRDSHWRMGLRLLSSIENPACIIALTDAPSDGLLRSLLEYGVYDVQAKPLKNNMILAKSVNAAHQLILSCDSL
jgi:hypothetical protein